MLCLRNDVISDFQIGLEEITDLRHIRAINWLSWMTVSFVLLIGWVTILPFYRLSVFSTMKARRNLVKIKDLSST